MSAGTGIGVTYQTFKERTTTPATPGATYDRFYFKSDGVYYVNSAGTATKIMGENGLAAPGAIGGSVPAAGSFTQLNTGYATVASHATTSAIWAAAGSIINFTGSETLTALPAAPQAGAQRTLICAATPTFTHAGALTVQGGVTYTATAGDVILVTATSTTAFKINIIRQSQTGTGVTVLATGPTLTGVISDTLKLTTGAGLGYLPKSDADGDISYLASVATGSVLASGGAGADPAWSATPSVTSLTASSAVTGVPVISKGPAIINAPAGTVTATASTTVVFSVEATAALAGYSATNPVLGATLISNALTRYIISWTNSTTCVVDTGVTWAGTAITSVQLPLSFETTSAGILKRVTFADGSSRVVLDTAAPAMKIFATAGDYNRQIIAFGSEDYQMGVLGENTSANAVWLGVNYAGATANVDIRTGSVPSQTTRLRVTGAGNVGIGTTTFGTSAAGVLSLGVGTDASDSPANTSTFVVKDVGGVADKAAFHMRSENGDNGPVAFANNRIIVGSTGLTLGINQVVDTVISNTGQGVANVNHTLPAAAEGYRFKAVVGEAQGASYFRFTRAGTDEVILDGTGSKTYVQIAAPTRGAILDMMTLQVASTGIKTGAAVAIGVTTKNLVSSGAFTFDIAGTGYAASATADGTAVQVATTAQNRWGAQFLEVGIDGTIHTVAGTSIAAGFATEAEAIAELATQNATASHTKIGHVTAMRTNILGFVWATTVFNDAETTANFYSTAVYTKPHAWIATTIKGTWATD